MWPYRKLLRSSSLVYFLLYWRPTILIRLLISAFSRICNHTRKHTQSNSKFRTELEVGNFFQNKALFCACLNACELCTFYTWCVCAALLQSSVACNVRMCTWPYKLVFHLVLAGKRFPTGMMSSFCQIWPSQVKKRIHLPWLRDNIFTYWPLFVNSHLFCLIPARILTRLQVFHFQCRHWIHMHVL